MSLNNINDLFKGWSLSFVEQKTVHQHIFDHLILNLFVHELLNGCVSIKLAIQDIMLGLMSLLPLKRIFFCHKVKQAATETPDIHLMGEDLLLKNQLWGRVIHVA